MDKGYLGKISRNVHPINQVVMSKPNTMFKFLSAQQCLAKDNQTKDRLLSQNTDISDDIS